jgi:hypothetical protein
MRIVFAKLLELEREKTLHRNYCHKLTVAKSVVTKLNRCGRFQTVSSRTRLGLIQYRALILVDLLITMKSDVKYRVCSKHKIGTQRLHVHCKSYQKNICSNSKHCKTVFSSNYLKPQAQENLFSFQMSSLSP